MGLALFLFAACGDDARETPDPDAGVDAGDDAGDYVPPEPEPAAPPVLLPCPAGWDEVVDPDDPEVVVCEPWPAGGALDCAVDQAHFPGTDGCERIGSACPAGDFADDLPAEGVVYVLAGAGPGGDGTIGSPFTTIGEGLAAAADGDVVALSKGTFDEVVIVDAPVTLWGACVAETAIAADPSGGLASTLRVTGRGGATIRNLRVATARNGIDVYRTNDPVMLESIVVDGAAGLGVSIFDGAEVEATDFVVRGTESDDAEDVGYGLYLYGGATATFTRAVVLENRTAGVFAWDGATLRLEDAAIRGTRPREMDGDYGMGLAVEGATALLARTVVEDNVQRGLRASAEGTIEVEDSVIRRTDEQPLDIFEARSGLGQGVVVGEGARVTLRRTLVEHNHSEELFGEGVGTLDATDVVVRDAEALAVLGNLGHGLLLRGGATATFERVAILRARVVGLWVDGTGSTLDATDVRIRAVRSWERVGDFGYGLHLLGGAHVTMTRTTVDGTHRAAISAFGTGTVGTFTDLVALDTLERECASDADGCPDGLGGGGTGLGAFDGAHLSASRFAIRRSALCGVQIAGGGEIDLSEGEIASSPVGANVQGAGFDVSRLQNHVRYVENGVNLDGSALPVPASLEDL